MGRAAASRLAGLPYGSKEAGLKRIAGGQNPHSVRRAIAAINFIDGLVKEKLASAAAFERLSLTAVEHFARLYRRDRKAAIAILDDFIAGRYSVSAIRDLEQGSRSKDVFERKGRSLEVAFKKQVLPLLQAHASGSLLSKLQDPIKEQWRRLADFAFYDRHEEPVEAALIVGPYSDTLTYEKRLFEWIAKGEYLRRHFPIVMLILPDNADLEKFEAWKAGHPASLGAWRYADEKTELRFLSIQVSRQATRLS